MGLRLGVDVGGTFTDLVAVGDDGRVLLGKVPSVPADQARGVLAAVARAGFDPGEVERFAHGTTVATNALLERRGAVTALVTTRGFADIIEIGRQNRPALYDLTRDRPPQLIPRHLRFTVTERCGPDGVVVPLRDTDVAEVVLGLRAVDGLEAVAVCLLFSFAHPEHEQRVGRVLRDALPGVTVALSSQVLPRFREYERFATTAADAYLTPTLASYLASLERGTAKAGLPEPMVMRSSGGVVDVAAAAAHAAGCVLSGPAGGVVGAAYVAGLSGVRDLLTFDMGGTSTDVAPILSGQVQTTSESVLAGVPVVLPSVDVHSVSAGGGSVAWVDSGGALRVGPRSAGAEPGPACYGRGGVEATVTDADFLLGHLADGTSFGGEVTLSREAAHAALSALGDSLGLSALEAAAGVVAVADAEMTRALRVVSVERGIDPRDLALLAFGGAGAMHACALADELGIGRILVPLACGVLSALGLALSDIRQDHLVSVFGPVDEVDLDGPFDLLAARARKELPGAEVVRWVDCRYAGQSHELTVTGDDVRAAFEAEHDRRYGYRAPDRPVEVVAVRVVATVAGSRPRLSGPPADPSARRTSRAIFTAGGWTDVPVVPRAALGAGDGVDGPAVVEFAEATCLVRAGWRGEVDDVGTLVLTRTEAGGA